MKTLLCIVSFGALIAFAWPLATLEATLYSQDIQQAQMKLKELGYDPGPSDGIWGSRTEAAVLAFQKDRGLSITGELDNSTRAELGLAAPQTPRRLKVRGEVVKIERSITVQGGPSAQGKIPMFKLGDLAKMATPVVVIRDSTGKDLTYQATEAAVDELKEGQTVEFELSADGRTLERRVVTVRKTKSSDSYVNSEVIELERILQANPDQADSLVPVLEELILRVISTAGVGVLFSIPGFSPRGGDTGSLTIRGIHESGDPPWELAMEFPNDRIPFSLGVGQSGTSIPLAHGSVHRFDGAVRLIEGYRFIGEGERPYRLTFGIVKDQGYIYLRGKGRVITPSGEEVRLGY